MNLLTELDWCFKTWTEWVWRKTYYQNYCTERCFKQIQRQSQNCHAETDHIWWFYHWFNSA